MCLLVSKVVYKGIFEAVYDAELFAEPKDALGLRILQSAWLAAKVNGVVQRHCTSPILPGSRRIQSFNGNERPQTSGS